MKFALNKKYCLNPSVKTKNLRDIFLSEDTITLLFKKETVLTFDSQLGDEFYFKVSPGGYRYYFEEWMVVEKEKMRNHPLTEIFH
jgi:hypothetical protein